jgi:hypothetical protein
LKKDRNSGVAENGSNSKKKILETSITIEADLQSNPHLTRKMGRIGGEVISRAIEEGPKHWRRGKWVGFKRSNFCTISVSIDAKNDSRK